MNAGRYPLGVVWDVDPGSHQLLIYGDGLLGLPVPFWNRVGFALRYVRGGAPVVFDPGRGFTREERRIRDLVMSAQPRDLATQVDRAFFIGEEQIVQARLIYRVAFSALDLTLVGPTRRRFKWTPSVNPLRPVRQVLSATLGPRFAG